MVDLNFECPVRRLLARGEGGALLADPPAIARLVAAVVRARVDSRDAEDSQRPGHRTPHGSRGGASGGTGRRRGRQRSRPQRRPGLPRRPGLGIDRQRQAAVQIPVIGSGGIRTAADAVHFLRESGADAVAIARGCAGQSVDFFARPVALLGGATAVRGPTPAERGRVLMQLVEGEFRLYGPPLALRRLPRTSGYFAQFLPEAAAFRQAVRQVKNLAQFRRLVGEYFV